MSAEEVGAVAGVTAAGRPDRYCSPAADGVPPLPRNAAALLAEWVSSPRLSGGTAGRLVPKPAPSPPPFPLLVLVLLLALLYVV